MTEMILLVIYIMVICSLIIFGICMYCKLFDDIRNLTQRVLTLEALLESREK